MGRQAGEGVEVTRDLTRESASIRYYGYKDEVRRLALGDHESMGTDVRIDRIVQARGHGLGSGNWDVTVSWIPWEPVVADDVVVAMGESLDADAASCPTCKVGPGEMCVTPAGWTTDTHAARVARGRKLAQR